MKIKGSRYLHRRQFIARVLRTYWKTTLFKDLREFLEETMSYFDIQHRLSTRRRIFLVRTSLHFYLIQRCAGHSTTDVTRLLDPPQPPVQATDIVKKYVLLLVKHVLWKKRKNKKKWKKKKKKVKKKEEKNEEKKWRKKMKKNIHPKKGQEIPTSVCACAHQRERTPYGKRHFRWKHQKRVRNPISWPLVTSGSHGSCTTLLHYILLQ